MTANYDNVAIGERETAVGLQKRWTEFMRYANRKVRTIDSTFLREYANFVSNVALRYGAITALANCPEVPNEVLGGVVRDYEKELVAWSGHLADIERREADFRKRLAEVRNAENEVRSMAGSVPQAACVETLGCASIGGGSDDHPTDDPPRNAWPAAEQGTAEDARMRESDDVAAKPTGRKGKSK